MNKKHHYCQRSPNQSHPSQYQYHGDNNMTNSVNNKNQQYNEVTAD